MFSKYTTRCVVLVFIVSITIAIVTISALLIALIGFSGNENVDIIVPLFTVFPGVFICVVVIILAVYYRKSYSKIIILANDGQYEKAIMQGKRFKKYALNLLQSDMADINISYSYLALGDESNFDFHINLVASKSILTLKYFWLTFNRLLRSDISQAKIYYNDFVALRSEKQIKGIRSKEEYNELLLAAFAYEEGELENAKERIDKFHSQFNIPIMRNYFSNALLDIERRISAQ